LDRAFRLYRKNFVVFISIVAITQLPLAILNVINSAIFVDRANSFAQFPLNPDPSFQSFAAIFGPFLLAALLIGVAALVLTQIGMAALTRAVAADYLGRPITLLEILNRIGNDWLRLLGTTLLFIVLLIAVMIPLLLLNIIPCLGNIASLLGFLAMAMVGGAIGYLTPPVVVLEKKAWLTALKRSWRLVSFRFWWVVGYIILLGLLNAIVVLGPAALVGVAFREVIFGGDQLASTVIQQGTSVLFTSLFTPLQLTAVTLMYFDLRIRFEGFDLKVLAAAGGEGDDLDSLVQST
jgi:membrane-anchored glycerophosphoryl diester phosphodiesterase (GDPDase)